MIGIHLLEKDVVIAIQKESEAEVAALKYAVDLDFGDIEQLGRRLWEIQEILKETMGGAAKHAVVSTSLSLTPIDWLRLKRCGRLVGLSVERIIPNLTTACLYCVYKETEKEQMILSYRQEERGFSMGLCSSGGGVCEVLWNRHFDSVEPVRELLQETRVEYDWGTAISISERKDKAFFERELLPLLPADQQGGLQFIHDPLAPALGSLVMGGVLTGNVKDILLLEALSHSYGISVSGEEEILYCKRCWLRVKKSHRKRCSQCRKSLEKERMGYLGVGKKNFKMVVPIVQADQTIPTRDEQIIFIEKGVSLVQLETMDSQGKRLFSKRVRLPKAKKEEQEGGLYCFQVDIDAAQRVVLTIAALPEGELCQKSFTPNVAIPRGTKARIVEQAAVPPKFQTKTMEPLFGLPQYAHPKKRRKRQKVAPEDVSMEQLLREINPGLSQEEVNALLSGLVFPLPGHENELDRNAAPWFPQNDQEQEEVEAKLRKLLGDEESSYDELVQQYQKRMQDIYWPDDLDDLEWSDVERDLNANKERILNEADQAASSSDTQRVQNKTNDSEESYDFEAFDNLDDLDWSDVEEELRANKRRILREAKKNEK